MPFEEINWLMAEANTEVLYYNAFAKGFTLLTMTPDQVEGEFIKVSTVKSRDYFATTDAKFIARQNEVGDMGHLQKIVISSTITSG